MRSPTRSRRSTTREAHRAPIDLLFSDVILPDDERPRGGHAASSSGIRNPPCCSCRATPTTPSSTTASSIRARRFCRNRSPPTRSREPCARCSTPTRRRSLRQVEAIDPAVQRSAADPEQFGGGRLVAAGLVQHPFDVIPLRVGEVGIVGQSGRDVPGKRRRRDLLERGALRRQRRLEIALAEDAVVADDAGALDDVAQLADVARPGRLLQQTLGGRRDAGDRPLQPLGAVPDERGR